jgi:hypothetical protein
VRRIGGALFLNVSLAVPCQAPGVLSVSVVPLAPVDTLTPLAAGAAASREEVDADFYDNWEYAGNAAATVVFRNPVIADSYPWAFNLGGGYIYREYDAPDPTIDATEAEEDDEYWVSGALNVPVQEWLAIIPQAEYRNRESNYDTRDFEAVTLSLGLFAKF